MSDQTHEVNIGGGDRSIVVSWTYHETDELERDPFGPPSGYLDVVLCRDDEEGEAAVEAAERLLRED